MRTKDRVRLDVVTPPYLADAVASIAGRWMQSVSEYTRTALRAQLRADGIELLEKEEAAA